MEKRERLLFLDIARGWAVLFMFTQHCMLVYEVDRGDSSHPLSLLFVLLGTAPAAPVFMVIMGLFQGASRCSRKEMIFRGLRIFGLGYLLNLLRAPLFLPDSSLRGGEGGLIAGILTTNDILQLAGLSILAGAVLKGFLRRRIAPLLLFGAVFIISPLLWGLFPQIPLLDPFWGSSEMTSFPFFPWVVYPLFGVYLSPGLLGEGVVADSGLKRLAYAGCVVGMLGIAAGFSGFFPLGDYSRSGLAVHLGIIAFVLIWLRLCRLQEKALSRENLLIRGLAYLSRNLTQVYFTQWILFSWGILFWGANNRSPGGAALIGGGVFGLTLLILQIRPVKKLLDRLRV